METAFFNTAVECPVCKKENNFETIRVGAYVESGRDTDFCPTDIKWRFPEYENVNPLVFFVATCPNCLYSREFNDSFKKWQNDVTFKTYRLKRVKERHLEELAKDGSIIKRLGEMIDLKKRPNETAIAKLLLAVYDEQLNDRPSNLDLGRMYIRLGWIFRGMDSFPEGAVSMANTENADIELKAWSEALQALLNNRQSLFSKMDSLLSDKESRFATDAERWRELQERILAHENKLSGLETELSEALNKPNIQLGEDETGDVGSSSPDVFSLMAALKQQWDGVPLNERDALRMAAESYTRALEEGKEVSAGNQQVQVCYLIAEISRRIGMHAEARDFFNSVLKVGQEFVRRYQSDKSRTALARRILELAMEQSQINREAMKQAAVN